MTVIKSTPRWAFICNECGNDVGECAGKCRYPIREFREEHQRTIYCENEGQKHYCDQDKPKEGDK